MRFDLIANFSPGETIPWTRTLEMIREQTALAEEAGFTTSWFTEHHFAHNGYMNAPPNPILMGAHVAAHCRKIRVGTCPVILPDWHPLRVAEDVAMLDNMTLGRVDFGVAKGVNERSTIQFNRDADRRDNDKVFRLFQESLEVILKAWTDEAFTHKGEFYEFPVPGWKETNRFFSRSTRAITRKTESIRRSTSIRGPIRSRIRRSGCSPTRRPPSRMPARRARA
jgi:alkanesulfonate monooxygenase SsuD/methylene tetrahydromethanopterin reductase-like flavin-dependent oxidoreductase (luciferase family)